MEQKEHIREIVKGIFELYEIDPKIEYDWGGFEEDSLRYPIEQLLNVQHRTAKLEAIRTSMHVTFNMFDLMVQLTDNNPSVIEHTNVHVVVMRNVLVWMDNYDPRKSFIENYIQTFQELPIK